MKPGNKKNVSPGPKQQEKDKTLEKAKEAVEVWLGIKGFINDNEERICSRIEEYDENVTQQTGEMKVAADVTFIADCLPLISGVVNVGSSQEKYEKAREWIKNEFPNHEPIPLLSALTFIYIANESKYVTRIMRENTEKKEIWERIQERLWKNLTRIG